MPVDVIGKFLIKLRFFMKCRILYIFIGFQLFISLGFGQERDLFHNQSEIEKKQKDYNKLKSGWNLGLDAEFTVTQTAYQDWEAGGTNLFVWTAGSEGTAIYDTTSWNWATESKLRYGLARQNGKATRKTDDIIDLESVATLKENKLLNPYFSMNFRTQMSAGYKYSDEGSEKISDFLDPGYLTGGVGVGYSPKKSFRTRIGLASRTIITRNYHEYADGENIQTEAGLQWVTHVERKFWDKLLLKSRLKLFSSFDQFEKGNIDWDTLLQFSLTKYIIINMQTYLIYQPEISLRTQLKEILSVGLRYTFI